jgi:hypothetical protein
VTFEEWYAEHYDFRLRVIPVEDPNDDALKKLMATVWNAALDAVEQGAKTMDIAHAKDPFGDMMRGLRT